MSNYFTRQPDGREVHDPYPPDDPPSRSRRGRFGVVVLVAALAAFVVLGYVAVLRGDAEPARAHADPLDATTITLTPVAPAGEFYPVRKLDRIAKATARYILTDPDGSNAAELLKSHALATGCEFRGFGGYDSPGDVADPQVAEQARAAVQQDGRLAGIGHWKELWMIVVQDCGP